MEENLEQSKAGEEQPVEEVSKEEQPEGTPEPEKEISGKIYTEEELQERLRGLQSKKDAEIADISKKFSTVDARSRTAETRLADLEKRLEKKDNRILELEDKIAETFDDPEAYRKARIEERKLEMEREELRRKEAKLQQEIDDTRAWYMSRKADDLAAKFGVPIEALFAAQDERDMELIAYRYIHSQKPAEPEKKPEPKEEQPSAPEAPEFDAGVSSGFKPSEAQIYKDCAEGKITPTEAQEKLKKLGKSII